MDEENWHRMVGVGAAKLGHIVTLTQFHITESFSHSTSLSLFKVFEAASAEKASSSLKKDSELPRSATVFTAHWDGRKAVIGREGKRERWGRTAYLSLSAWWA